MMRTFLEPMIRHALTAGGGALAAKGLLDAGEVQAIVGAVMTLVGIVWSIAEKRART